MTDIEALRQILDTHGQSHLLAFYDELSTPHQELLLQQIQAVDFAVRQSPGVELLGPSRAALYRINNRFRWHLILRSRETAALQSLVTQCLANRQLRKLTTGKIKITVDVDPMNLL